MNNSERDYTQLFDCSKLTELDIFNNASHLTDKQIKDLLLAVNKEMIIAYYPKSNNYVKFDMYTSKVLEIDWCMLRDLHTRTAERYDMLGMDCRLILTINNTYILERTGHCDILHYYIIEDDLLPYMIEAIAKEDTKIV